MRINNNLNLIKNNNIKNIFDFVVKDANGKLIKLSDYNENNPILIVNVATYWGLAERNYSEMQNLYQRYKDKGFMILGFPCNQFGNQERDSNQEIQKFLKDKGITFPVFGKIDVNGKNQDPLYKYLKSQKKDFFFGEDIKWNFTKFLCDKGVPIKRYGPQVNPYSFEDDIKKLL